MNLKSVIGVLLAVGAGATAFFTEMDNQKKDKKIAEMETRIRNLEDKETE